MLIAIMPEEIHKLNDFQLYSQNPTSLLCCGVTNDIKNEAIFTEIAEIPRGQEQRCLPQGYGRYLNLEQIEQGLADYITPEQINAEYTAAYQEGVNSAYDQ